MAINQKFECLECEHMWWIKDVNVNLPFWPSCPSCKANSDSVQQCDEEGPVEEEMQLPADSV